MSDAGAASAKRGAVMQLLNKLHALGLASDVSADRRRPDRGAAAAQCAGGRDRRTAGRPGPACATGSRVLPEGVPAKGGRALKPPREFPIVKSGDNAT